METLSYYRTRLGLVAPEDRLRGLRARRPRKQPEPVRELPEQREGERRWSVASLLALIVAKRDPVRSARKATNSSGYATYP